MSIADGIVRVSDAGAGDVAVDEVRIGLGYTAVALADGRVGLAYTFRDAGDDCCSVLEGQGELAGRTAADLLPWVRSSYPIEAAVGLATANALTTPDPAALVDGDVLLRLGLGPDDDVAMVGHFHPMVERLRRQVRSLTIFERVAAPDGTVRAADEAPEGLRRCHVALITATTVINHTVDPLLEAARGCRKVALLGASTPLVPQAFEGTGVTLLSGVVVEHPRDVLRVVSEGGGMRRLRPHVRKVSVEVETTHA